MPKERTEMDSRLNEALTEILTLRVSKSLMRDIEGFMGTMQREKGDTARIMLQCAAGWPVPMGMTKFKEDE